MHIHILGICGTFMGGVAQLACEAGHKVTGCDAHVYPPMSDALRNAGIVIMEGYDVSQLDAVRPDVDLDRHRRATQPPVGRPGVVARRVLARWSRSPGAADSGARRITTSW